MYRQIEKTAYIGYQDIKDDELEKLYNALCDFHRSGFQKNNLCIEYNSDEFYFEDLEVEIECEYIPACKGTRGEYGQQMEPDEPEHFDSWQICFKVGKNYIYIEDILNLSNNELVELLELE